MDSFKNPQSIKQLSAENGIDLSKYPSLLPSLRGAPSNDSMFRPVRQRQMRVWAHSSVADGVMHFKQGRHTEAFQCLTKALQIDAENVEAYVAKGALLANLGRYEKAIKDFEVAMKLDPKHENARKYLCETLVELGKQWEEKEKLLEAEKCLLRCLELDKDHAVGKEALKAVGSKLGKSLGLTDLFGKPDVKEEIKEEEEQKEEKDFTDDFEQTEKELLKRKRVKHEEDDIADLPSSPKSPKKLEKPEAVKEASLSPLSQKMSRQQSMWSAPEPQSDDISPIPRSGEPVESLVPAKPMFSNPPSAWQIPNTTMPPPSLTLPMPPMHPVPQPNFEMHNYTEDSNYKAKVEEFLRHLEKKSNASANKRSKRSRRSSEKSMPKKKERKRRKRSISSSSRSMSSSDASSSASDSSSSQTDDSDESEGARKRKRAKRRKKKRKAKKDVQKKVAAAEAVKKAKEEEKKMREDEEERMKEEEERKEEERKQKEEEKQEQEKKEQERREEEKKAKKKAKKEKKENKKKKDIFEAAELPIPDFKELEQKLQAYYKKMESISLPEAPQPEMLVGAGPKLDIDDKFGAAPASANSSVGLKQPTHPAFLESDSENESKEAKKKEQKKEPKKDQKEATKARMVGAAKTPKDDEKAKQKNRAEDSASSRSPSRSRSRSYSRSSRSYSSGSRSRSSRSRSHSRSRQFRRRQRSSSQHRERFERGRWRGRGFIRRSRSPNKNLGRWRHSSRSPPYGYYHNKPFYSFHRGGGRGFRAYHHQNRHNHHNNFHNHHNRNQHQHQHQHQGRYERPPPPPHHRRRSPSSPGSPIDSPHFGRRSDSDWHRSSTGEALDDAKRKVERRLADQEDQRSSDEGEGRRRSVSRERSEEKDDMKPRQPSPDPSKRFGKWAEGANGKVSAEKVKVVAEKSEEIPVATEEAKEAKLDEFESFLQKAKKKSMQVMRERNKEFLKPSE